MCGYSMCPALVDDTTANVDSPASDNDDYKNDIEHFKKCEIQKRRLQCLWLLSFLTALQRKGGNGLLRHHHLCGTS